MSQEQTSLSAILDKMDAIANEHYGGNTADNVYSIYMRLNDLEKIQFTKHAYRFCRAILSVTSVTSCGKAHSGCYTGEDPLSLEDASLEVSDKRELVRMKHDAILAVSKMVFAMLCFITVGLMVLSFISPDTMKALGHTGTLIGVILGG